MTDRPSVSSGSRRFDSVTFTGVLVTSLPLLVDTVTLRFTSVLLTSSPLLLVEARAVLRGGAVAVASNVPSSRTNTAMVLNLKGVLCALIQKLKYSTSS